MEIIWSSPEIGRRIRYYRTKRKLSQKALARMVGVSVYRIRLMESGRVMQADSLIFSALCHAFNVDMEVLTNLDGEFSMQH